MFWHDILGNLIALALNVIHTMIYLDLRRPRLPRFVVGMTLLALPWLFPWSDMRYGPAFGQQWFFLFPVFFLYTFVVLRFVMFQGGSARVLYTTLAAGCFTNVTLILIHALFVYLLGWPAAGLSVWSIRLSQLVFCGAVFPFIHIYVRKPFRQVLDVVDKGKWYVRNIAPMFFYTMGYLVIGLIYTDTGLSTVLLSLTVTGATVSHYIVAYINMVQESRNRFLNEMLDSSRKLLPVFQRYSAELDRKERTIRTLRHDLRHVLGGLTLAARDGDPEALAEYARSIAALDDGTEILAHSNNQAVNAIVSYYFSLAAGSGVRCEAKLTIPEDQPLSDPELVMLFGNALENCAKAAMPLGTDGRVSISAKAVKDCLVFKAVNNYRPGEKGRGEGLGINSMRMLCEKHGGRLDLQYGDGEFMLTAILKLEE